MGGSDGTSGEELTGCQLEKSKQPVEAALTVVTKALHECSPRGTNRMGTFLLEGDNPEPSRGESHQLNCEGVTASKVETVASNLTRPCCSTRRCLSSRNTNKNGDTVLEQA